MANKKKKWEDMTLSERKASFNQHFRVYLVMGVFFFLLNLVTAPGNWWSYWPILGWGIGVGIQALSVYGPWADTDESIAAENGYGQGQLNAPQSQMDDSLELKELEKRYNDDDLV